MLLLTVIKSDGRRSGHRTLFNRRLQSKSHRLARAPYKQIVGARGALDERAAERAVLLEAPPGPGQLHQQPAHPRIAVLADAVLALRAPPLNGVPVRPTELAIVLRSRNVRRNTSHVSTVAVPSPIP